MESVHRSLRRQQSGQADRDTNGRIAWTVLPPGYMRGLCFGWSHIDCVENSFDLSRGATIILLKKKGPLKKFESPEAFSNLSRD
jgi:hypothetical protein